MRRGLLVLPFIVFTLIPAVSFAQAGSSLAFRGTPVTPFGAASVSVAGNRLYVGNLGSSGSDGFHVDTEGAQGVHIRWSTPMVQGEQFTMMAFWCIGGANMSPGLIMNKGAVNLTIAPDFSGMGATSFRAEVWNAGSPVAAISLPSTASVSSTGEPMSFDSDGNGAPLPLPDPYPLPATSPYGPVFVFRLQFAAPSTFDGPAGPIGVGDALYLFPEVDGTGGGEIDSEDFVISQSQQAAYTFEVDDIAQSMFGRLHRGTQDAVISCESAHGITMSLPPGGHGSLEFEMDSPERKVTIKQQPRSGSAGDTDDVSIMGEVAGGGQAEIGKVSGTCNGTAWVMTPDFSGSGSPDTDVQLFNEAGVLVAENPDMIGSVTVGSGALPIAITVDGTSPNGPATIHNFPAPVPMSVPGLGVIAASGIRFGSKLALTNHYSLFAHTVTCGAGGVALDIRGEANELCFCALAGGLSTAARGGPQPSHNRGSDAWVTAAGSMFLEPREVSVVGSLMDTSDPANALDFHPVVSRDNFAIAWAPPGAAGATPGETDWELMSRLTSDAAPIDRMAVRMASDGINVNLFASPRQTPSTSFHIRVKNGSSTVADYTSADENASFASVPEWPLAVSYQVLHDADKTWSMGINFGYPTTITLPTGPAGAHNASAAQIVTGTYIEVILENTPITSPVAESSLSMKPVGNFWRLFDLRELHAVGVGDTPSATVSVLHAPYPNPFNPSTTIAFDLAASGEVTLNIYSVRGERVATVYSGWMKAGPHMSGWNGRDQRGVPAASGVYLVELRTPDGTRHAKLNLVK